MTAKTTKTTWDFDNAFEGDANPRYSVCEWLPQEVVDARSDGQILGEKFFETDDLAEAVERRDEINADFGADYALIWDTEHNEIAGEPR